MCGTPFFATAELIEQGNLAVADDAVAKLAFDERTDLPSDADGFKVTLRAIGVDNEGSLLVSRKSLSVADMATQAPGKMDACAGFSTVEIFVRGSFANGETLYFLATASGMSLAYSIEAVRTPFNAGALA